MRFQRYWEVDVLSSPDDVRVDVEVTCGGTTRKTVTGETTNFRAPRLYAQEALTLLLSEIRELS